MPDSTPTNHELHIEITKVKGTMEAQQADYRTGWKDIHASMAEFKTEMAKRDADRVEREAERAKQAAKREAEQAKQAAKREAEQAKQAAERDADHRAEIARFNAEAAQRDKDNQKFLITLFGIFIVILIGLDNLTLPNIRSTPTPPPIQTTQIAPPQ